VAGFAGHPYDSFLSFKDHVLIQCQKAGFLIDAQGGSEMPVSLYPHIM